MAKETVEQRIDDWIKRLRDLFARIHEWYGRLPQAEKGQIFDGSLLQQDEAPMREFDVPPKMLPTCSIIYGKNRVSLVPSALWVLGVNGRINVTVGGRQYPLVDFGGREGAQSDWRIVTSHLQNIHIPFTEEVFQNLVLHQTVEQPCAR